MPGERKPSGINVEVLDLTPVLNQAYRRYMSDFQNSKATGMEADYAYARYIDPEGRVYLLNSEGVGSVKGHISETVKATIMLYAVLCSPHLLPDLELHIGAEEIRKLPSTSTVPLEEFIRQFGSRLEGNYHLWLNLLTRASNGGCCRESFTVQIEGRIDVDPSVRAPARTKALRRLCSQQVDLDDLVKLIQHYGDSLRIEIKQVEEE